MKLINILLVDDSKTILKIYKEELEKLGDINVITTMTLKETVQTMNKIEDIDLVLLDINLPDSTKGEIIAYVNKQDIPMIVLTGTVTTKDLNKKYNTSNILDYVVKEGHSVTEYIGHLITRLRENSQKKCLIVSECIEKSKTLQKLLEIYNLNVTFVSSEDSCIDLIKYNTDFNLLILDNNKSTKINGVNLIKEIRKYLPKEQTGILGLNNEETGNELDLYKYGANDVVNIDASNSEILLRINNTLEGIELIQAHKLKANKDYITNLFNKRYFFEKGYELYENSSNIFIATLELDISTKEISHKFGYGIADQVTLLFKGRLSEKLMAAGIDENNIFLSRLRDDTFGIVVRNKNEEKLLTLLDNLRGDLERDNLLTSEKKFEYTVSIGVTNNKKTSFIDMVEYSEEALYQAREEGGNRVKFLK